MLNYEERDMFSLAFKSALSGRRQAVRIAMMFEQQDPANANLAAGYRSKVEAELTDVCSGCTNLIASYLLPNPGDDEAKIFYLKMMGDYFRYMAEFAEDLKKQENASQAQAYYAQGFQEAAQVLPTIHPTRLGLALNFSVFLHEVAGQTREAIATAESAFGAACADADALAVSPTRDESTVSMQLLQDNLALWSQGQ